MIVVGKCRPAAFGVALAVAAAVTLPVTGGVLSTGGAPVTHAAATLASGGVRIFPQVERVGRTTAAPPTSAYCQQAYDIKCYGPTQLQTAYGLPGLYRHGDDGRGTTIAIVDAFGSPTIRHDLAAFDRAYHLAAPPSLKIIKPAGGFRWRSDSAHRGWAFETTLDVEYAHAMAPGAKILLAETPTDETEGTAGFPQIVQAENYIVRHRLADVISQSFGATEQTFPSARSLLQLRSAYVAAAKRGITVLAASGDNGATSGRNTAGTTFFTHRVTGWPATDPLVTAVGGTSLDLHRNGSRIRRDVAWNDTDGGFSPAASGGGQSSVFDRPSWQRQVAAVTGSHRGIPDISMSASSSHAVNVYVSSAGGSPGWQQTGGTSEATPLFAGIVALAMQRAHHRLGLIDPALYRLSAQHAAGIVPVTSGNNTVSFWQGDRSYTVHGFAAGSRYNLVTGLGTVDGKEFVPELARAAG